MKLTTWTKTVVTRHQARDGQFTFFTLLMCFKQSKEPKTKQPKDLPMYSGTQLKTFVDDMLMTYDKYRLSDPRHVRFWETFKNEIMGMRKFNKYRQSCDFIVTTDPHPVTIDFYTRLGFNQRITLQDKYKPRKDLRPWIFIWTVLHSDGATLDEIRDMPYYMNEWDPYVRACMPRVCDPDLQGLIDKLPSAPPAYEKA